MMWSASLISKLRQVLAESSTLKQFSQQRFLHGVEVFKCLKNYIYARDPGSIPGGGKF